MRNFSSIKVLVLLLIGCLLSASNTLAQPLPEHGLHYERFATVWDEAMPLGNGLLGALVWGDGKPLRISLDRTDLWDLRPVPEFHSKEYSYELMRQWVKEGRIDDLHRLYDKPYWYPGPTKIPAGRIEITLEGENLFRSADLDLKEAAVKMKLAGGTGVRVFVHATKTIGMISIEGDKKIDIKLLAPPFAGKVTTTPGVGISRNELAMLKYDAPVEKSGENWTGFYQEGWGGFGFAVAVQWKKSKNSVLASWSIATTKDSKDPLKAARKNCADALEQGFEKMLAGHKKWWDEYWSKSDVRIPNKVIERQWYLETYKFGAAARIDTPPISLQGPWTADNMKIPPWKGDYHHDLNTELCYWPCYSGNHLEGGLGFLNWLWNTKENARAWTKRFFDKPGLNIPMTSDINQEQIGGWHQYTHSSTTAAWLAHHFYLHWRYSMDREFLRERAYPFLKDVAVFLEAVTEKGADGKRTLPLSSSPEINDNRIDAWFATITNYDLSLIRWAFETTAELADVLGKNKEADHWRKVLGEMPEPAIDSDSKKLLVAKDYPLKSSHRHFSHLMSIHPLGTIRWENGAEDQKIIKASLDDLEKLGSSAWCGYSFSWLGNLAARARDGERAEDALVIFSKAFCLRSSFHCNGDQSGKGYSNFRYRPFTLEGNFAAAAGVQEMLIQSYSGTLRLFPAIPKDWKDVTFKTLRAEGAFLVSAEKKKGKVVLVEITCEKGGICKLENPFDGEYEIKGIESGKVKQKDNEILLSTSIEQKIILVGK
ncbi:MAG: glycosyl hydrolase family 95 catalytic domain-containing protein [Planctomycetota bacterium]|jgi:alpha-L-fucosidase 2